jgi:hypothetical protein
LAQQVAALWAPTGKFLFVTLPFPCDPVSSLPDRILFRLGGGLPKRKRMRISLLMCGPLR